MGRAMWKASLDVGSLELPVKLYAAVEERGLHFRLLHARDRVPVRQQMVDPNDERPVAPEEIQRGLEVAPGRFVVLRPDELERVEPRPSRSIEITRFVPPAAIDASWYERPYFLGPDGSAADYFAFLAALQESGTYGVARWVMRGQRRFGALAARDGHLSLLALHDAAEVVSARELARPSGHAASAGDRKLAEQLVSALEGSFDPGELRDDYRARLKKLIAAKRKGRRFVVRERLPERPAGDLGDVLRRSLRSVRGKRRAAA